MKRITIVVSSLFLVTASAQAFSVPAPLAAPDVLSPLPAHSVLIQGQLGAKLDICLSERLLAQDIEAFVKPFRVKDKIEYDWRSEYWGKWFTSLALADAYQCTTQTYAKLVDATQALLPTASPDGYFSTLLPEHRLEGWDVWGGKYVLLGLLAYYDRTGDATALAAASRHLDALMVQVGPGKKNIAELADHRGLQATSVLEPVVLLYRRTANPKYLAFAEYIVGQWSKPANPSRWPETTNGVRLIEDSLAGVPPDKMRWNKAYEMMSCFEGLCELYRVTGKSEYLDASVKMASNIMKNESTIVGLGTQTEVWCNGRTKQTTPINHPMETCVTATWMKFCYQLLRLTGDPTYVDELEKNLYNGLLGAMMTDGGWWSYFSGINGERVPSDMQHVDVGMSCCVVSGPRGLFLTPQWAVMSTSSGPVVNLYFPGKAQLTTMSGQKLVIAQKTDYPLGDTVEISLALNQPETFTIALRIPAWSEHSNLRINSRKVEVNPGSYAKIERRWKNGDRIKLGLDMRGRVVEAPDGNGQRAVTRGPLVLSLDNRLAPPQAGLVASLDSVSSQFIHLKSNPQEAVRIGAWGVFEVPFQINGQTHLLKMCDFASAGNQWTSHNRYRTWLPQPVDLASVYESGQTWTTLTHMRFRPFPPPSKKLRHIAP